MTNEREIGFGLDLEFALKSLEVAMLETEIERKDKVITSLKLKVQKKDDEISELKRLIKRYEELGVKDLLETAEKMVIVQNYFNEINSIGEKYNKLLGE